MKFCLSLQSGQLEQTMQSCHVPKGSLSLHGNRTTKPAMTALVMAPPRVTDQSLASGVMQMGPKAECARIHLPSATFLSEVPSLPGNVRVDFGHIKAKEFLVSGTYSPNSQAQPTGDSPVSSSGLSNFQDKENLEGHPNKMQHLDPFEPQTGGTGASSHLILSTLSDIHSQATVPVPPDLATSRRVRQSLPVEKSLPRRHVPAVGR